MASGLQTKTPEADRAGQLTVLPVLLSGVLPYVEADGLALEAFMAAQGDPQGAKGDPQGPHGGPQDNASGQHIWAAEHIEVGLTCIFLFIAAYVKTSNSCLAMRPYVELLSEVMSIPINTAATACQS